MPFVSIDILKGKSSKYKEAVLDGVHEALIQAIKIPEDDRFQRIHEIDKDDFKYSKTKSDNIIIIEITMFKGRTLEAKKDLYKAINHNLAQNPGIDGKDISILIYELPPENLVIRDGKPINET